MPDIAACVASGEAAHHFPDALERCVTATPDEYRRGLELAFPHQVREQGGLLLLDYSGEEGYASMTVRLERQADRVIASLRLPSLRVRLDFIGGHRGAREAMLRQMDRAMQRGGG
jgi:hypothetical protein